MACDANTLEALQVANRETALSERDLWMVRAAIFGAAAGLSTATDTQRVAQALGLSKLSERNLRELYAALACQLAS